MAAGLAVASILTPLAPLPASAATSWRSSVQALLDRRARAVETGDRTAFVATQASATRAYRTRALRWFDRVQALPIRSYVLRLGTDGYHDLAAAADQVPVADEVHVVPVTERLRFARYDPSASAETLYLTVARSGERWSVVDDTAVADLGLESAVSVWDLAPVVSVRGGDVMVITAGDRAAAERIRADAQAAVERVRARWPLPWKDRVVVVIARSAKDLAAIFHTTVDLSPFVAFAATSAYGMRGSYRLTGPRVYVQPDTFFSDPVSFQQQVFGHEMLHVAAARTTGVFTPAWLDEGVAQVYGETRARAPTVLDARVRAGTDRGRLPDQFEFFLGSREDISESYQASASFVRFLQARSGPDAPARFYRVLGRESAVSLGTARYHLDQASRAVFGTAFDRLERAWLTTLRG